MDSWNSLSGPPPSLVWSCCKTRFPDLPMEPSEFLNTVIDPDIFEDDGWEPTLPAILPFTDIVYVPPTTIPYAPGFAFTSSRPWALPAE